MPYGRQLSSAMVQLAAPAALQAEQLLCWCILQHAALSCARSHPVYLICRDSGSYGSVRCI
jgi:hypothetical protein